MTSLVRHTPYQYCLRMLFAAPHISFNTYYNQLGLAKEHILIHTIKIVQFHLRDVLFHNFFLKSAV